MVTIPGFNDLTIPFSTVAISLLDEVHIKLSSHVSSPLNWHTYPISIVLPTYDVWFPVVNLNPSYIIVTFISNVLVNSPNGSDTVIVTVPILLAVINPFSSIDKIFGLLDVYVSNEYGFDSSPVYITSTSNILDSPFFIVSLSSVIVNDLNS